MPPNRDSNTPPPNWQGRTLGDRYKVGRPLGEGGMSVVHVALDTRLDREVAVKILRTDVDKTEEFGRRLAREARAVARVQHPNVLVVHDAGYADDVVYVVVELLRGKALDEVLADDGPMPLGESVETALQVARGLEAVHAAGIIHRDVKPGNVFLLDGSARRLVKLLDFSIARMPEGISSVITAEGVVFGTPYYMAPEQALGKGATTRSDLYSLGAVLHEVLAGDPPFAIGTPLDVLQAHVQEPVPDLGRLRRGLPRELVFLVSQLLAKRPDERPESAGEVAFRLEAIRDAILAHSDRLLDDDILDGPTVPYSIAVRRPDDEATTTQSPVAVPFEVVAAEDEDEDEDALDINVEDDGRGAGPGGLPREERKLQPRQPRMFRTTRLGRGVPPKRED